MDEMGRTEEESVEEKKSDMARKVALGATGLAVASGVVVAGAVLARNEKARKAVKKGVGEMVKGARSMLMEGVERYKAVSHRISLGGRRKRSRRISGLGLARKRLGRH